MHAGISASHWHRTRYLGVQTVDPVSQSLWVCWEGQLGHSLSPSTAPLLHTRHLPAHGNALLHFQLRLRLVRRNGRRPVRISTQHYLVHADNSFSADSSKSHTESHPYACPMARFSVLCSCVSSESCPLRRKK